MKMIQITATVVRELRERTGAGMMDCKRALVEAGGDLEKAIDFLREKGLSTAAKKAGRVASEGLVFAEISSNQQIGILVEMNCETDFAAKNQEFKKLLNNVAKLIIREDPGCNEQLVNWKLPDGKRVGDALNALITTVGENINIRRFTRFEVNGIGKIVAYIHNDYLTEGKVGVLLEVHAAREETLSTPEFNALTKTLALQVASARPEYVRRDDVPDQILEAEKSIYKAQAVNEGKPEAVADRIMQGRVEKFYKENCLLEQAFIKDPDRTVAEWIKSTNRELAGEDIRVTGFVRYEKGEGIEKRKDDFAEEVMTQMKG